MRAGAGAVRPIRTRHASGSSSRWSQVDQVTSRILLARHEGVAIASLVGAFGVALPATALPTS